MHNQHRSPDPTKIERATATSTVALFYYFFFSSAIVTINACNGEKLSDLNIELPDDIERNIPNWVFPTQQTLKFTVKQNKMYAK